MINLPKLFIFAFWVTLIVWFTVEKLQQIEHTVAPTVVVTPSGE